MHVFSRIPFEWYNKLIFAVLDLSSLHWCRNRKFFTLIFAVLLQNFLNLLQNRVVAADVIDLSNRSLRSILQCWPFKIHCGPQNWFLGRNGGYMCIKSKKALEYVILAPRRKVWNTTCHTLLETHFGHFGGKIGLFRALCEFWAPYSCSSRWSDWIEP